jgi:methylenetetrahydrofolate reductase (NADPH)
MPNEVGGTVREGFGDLGIAVAGYPETHQKPQPGSRLANLKRKVDTGPDVVVTQLFYMNDDFFRFRDCCENWASACRLCRG